jgi:hypothetical protein
MAGTRRARRGSRTTRKRSTRSSSMTIEGLRASFDKINSRAKAAIESGRADSAVADVIDKSWSDMFHHGLSPAALKGLLLHYRALYRSRRTRKQRGGMAPLDWTLGQGTTAPVYGTFPVEMGAAPQAVAALDLDRHFENSISRSCDGTGIAPPKQTGGGVIDAMVAGHTPMSVPINVLQQAAGTLMGAPPAPNPSGAPDVAAWNYQTYTPAPFNPSSLSSISTLGPVYTA